MNSTTVAVLRSNRHLTAAIVKRAGACSIPYQFTEKFPKGGKLIDVAMFAYKLMRDGESNWLEWILDHLVNFQHTDKQLLELIQARVATLKVAKSYAALGNYIKTEIAKAKSLNSLESVLTVFDSGYFDDIFTSDCEVLYQINNAEWEDAADVCDDAWDASYRIRNLEPKAARKALLKYIDGK